MIEVMIEVIIECLWFVVREFLGKRRADWWLCVEGDGGGS
jgi:hypothetical protein